MLSVLLLAASCVVPAAIPLAGDYEVLDHQIEALADPNRSLTVQQLASEPYCGQFKSVEGTPNFGYVEGGMWLRMRPAVSNAASRPWRLSLPFAGLDEVCVYWPLQGNGTGRDCLQRGSVNPRDRAAYGHGQLLFALPANYDASRTTYLYATSSVWMKMPLALATADALMEHQVRSQFGWGAYHGILMTLALVGLTYFFGRRDIAYLYFALLITGLSLSLGIWQGYLSAWEPAGWSFSRLAPALWALVLTVSARFFQYFLETRKHVRVGHIALECVCWAGLATAAVALVNLKLAQPLWAVVFMVWCVSVIWSSWVRERAGFRPAAFVLAAMAMLVVTGTFVALAFLGVPLVTFNLVQTLGEVGTLLSSLVLLFGVMYRVRTVSDESSRATELALANERVALHRAHYDMLTGLANRGKFREDLHERLRAAEESGHGLALLCVGLDRFRRFSHALGHEKTEAVIKEISLRLKQSVHGGELVARVSADIFALLLTVDPRNKGEWQTRCEALQKQLSSPLLHGSGASLNTSIGVALYPDHAISGEMLLRAGDSALLNAQQKGGGALQIYSSEMKRHAEYDLELNKSLRQALLRNEFELHYQPVISLDRGALLGLEALIRWSRHGKMVPPAMFIPAAESSGLVVEIGEWVLREACRQLADWHARKLAIPYVAVNVSPRQLRVSGLAERINAILQNAGVPAGALVLELTESMLLDDLNTASQLLSQLRERGIRVSVDDFGVGYSSLSYLRNLPVHAIKIDRSFLQGIPQQPEAVSVISAMIALGHDLKLQVVAEGIETADQRIFLAERGVDAGQGYELAKPMTAQELEAWLMSPHRRPYLLPTGT